MIHDVAHWVAQHGYIVIFGIFSAGIIGVPVPNDLLLAYLGHFIYKGKLELIPTISGALLGSIVGMTFNYFIGKTVGWYLVEKYGGVIHITPEKVTKFRYWFEHSGRWLLLFSNFIPGVRHLAPIAAGSSKMSFVVFAFFSYAGTLVWVLLYILLGYYMEAEWQRESDKMHHLLIGISVAAALVFSGYLLWKKKKTGADKT